MKANFYIIHRGDDCLAGLFLFVYIKQMFNAFSLCKYHLCLFGTVMATGAYYGL